jgi:putative Mg2+ transporter-C (MgtC) family protein
MWANIWELALRLVAALFAGGAIGWEREWRNKPAGLRTHMLVSLGSAITILASIEYAEDFHRLYGLRIDPLRVVQGVIGGVGFLGAGAILQRHGAVQGLTTAASIWTAAAIGVTCAMGYFEIAGISVGLVLITLYLIGRLETKLPTQRRQMDDEDSPAS